MKLYCSIVLCLFILSGFALAPDTDLPVTSQRTDNAWLGLSSDWFSGANWSLGHAPADSETAFFQPGGNPAFIAGSAVCGGLNLQPGSTLVISSGSLTVSGSVELYGTLLSTTTFSSTISGNLTLYTGCTFNAMSFASTISLGGNLTVEQPTLLRYFGYLTLTGQNKTVNTQAALNIVNFVIAGGASISYSGTGQYYFYLSGHLTINPGGSFTNLNPQGFTIVGNLDAWNWDASLGVTFIGLMDSHINLHGNTIANVTVNKSFGATLYNLIPDSDLNISGDLVIMNGGVAAGSHTIYLGGDFNDYSEGLNFAAGTGNVVFNGPAQQSISGYDIFNQITLNKTGTGDNACLDIINGSVIECAVYNWTAGSLRVYASHFWAYDLLGNDLGGDILASDNGFVDLRQDSLGSVNCSGQMRADNFSNIGIQGGSGNYHFNAPGSLNLNQGSLFCARGVELDSGFAYSNNHGALFCSGDLIINSTDVSGSGGELDQFTNTDAALKISPGSVNDSLSIGTSAGSHINLTGDVNLGFKMHLEGNLRTNGHNLSVGNDIFVACDGGEASLEVNGGTLALAANKSLDIYDSSRLNVYGSSETDRAVVTCLNPTAGRYNLHIHDTGTLSANYGRFEYMGQDGIKIMDGASVDAMHSLSNCVFDHVAQNGTLLTVNNGQDITIENASFPAQIATPPIYNVSKTVDNGSVTFNNAIGAFSGADYENDPYGRISWNNALPAVADFTLTEMNGTSPLRLRLDWTYPQAGIAFNIYGSALAEGPFTLQYGNLQVNNLEFTPTEPQRFYIIRAVSGP